MGWTGIRSLASIAHQCVQISPPSPYATGRGSAFTVSKAAEVKGTLTFVCCGPS